MATSEPDVPAPEPDPESEQTLSLDGAAASSTSRLLCPACGKTFPTGSDLERCEGCEEPLVSITQEPSLVGRRLADKYDVTDKLGEGGMGSVYLAHQTTMDREVAIKVLRRQYSQNVTAIKRFHREARTASKLSHPNTITVYDSGQTDDGQLYLVMERLNGRPLDLLLEDEGRLSAERVVHIVAQVCDSLAEAHEHSITHRDLKPENVFIEPKYGNPEFVKVLDFGIAKIADDGQTQATATGMICGTPSYMSPEQAMGKTIDGRSDIYALGIMAWELLAGRKPYSGDSPMQVMLQHINADIPELPEPVRSEVPSALRSVVAAMMAKDSVARPASCQVLKRMLVESLGGAIHSESMTRVRQDAIGQSTADRARAVQAPTAQEKTGISEAVTPTLDVEELGQVRRTAGAAKWAALAAVLAAAVAGGVLVFGGGSEPPRVAEPVAKADGAARTAGSSQVVIGSREASVSPGAESGSVAAAGSGKPAEPSGAAAAGRAEAGEGAPPGAGVATGEGLRSVALQASNLAAAAAKAAARITWRVTSRPEGATVTTPEGQALGVTPLELTRDPVGGQVALTLQLAGYDRAQIEVAGDQDVTESVVLTKRRAVRAKTGPGASSPKPRPKRDAKPSKRPDSKPAGFGTF